jgi:hypothetical protein
VAPDHAASVTDGEPRVTARSPAPLGSTDTTLATLSSAFVAPATNAILLPSGGGEAACVDGWAHPAEHPVRPHNDAAEATTAMPRRAVGRTATSAL